MNPWCIVACWVLGCHYLSNNGGGAIDNQALDRTTTRNIMRLYASKGE